VNVGPVPRSPCATAAIIDKTCRPAMKRAARPSLTVKNGQVAVLGASD
jgi:hypothetical protein